MTAPTTPLTYNGFVAQLAVLAVLSTTTTNGVTSTSDAALNTALPEVLNYAELRLQRDLALQALQTSSNSYSFVSGANLFQVPVADFVVVDTISVNTGSSVVPLTPTSKEFIQNVYGSSAGSGVPAYVAPYGGDQSTAGQTSTNFIVGPWPDQSYPAVVTGMQRAPSLALYATQADAATKVTWLSTWLPDLLVIASMIYVSAEQRNWSAQSDDPRMALSYEAQYQALLAGAQVEEARKRFAASGWSAAASPVAATPGR